MMGAQAQMILMGVQGLICCAMPRLWRRFRSIYPPTARRAAMLQAIRSQGLKRWQGRHFPTCCAAMAGKTGLMALQAMTRLRAVQVPILWRVAQGWTDALRARHPNGGIWTFWDYQAGAWQRDAGFRIDHLLLSPAVADRLVEAGVDKAYRGREKASDHAPTWVRLR